MLVSIIHLLYFDKFNACTYKVVISSQWSFAAEISAFLSVALLMRWWTALILSSFVHNDTLYQYSQCPNFIMILSNIKRVCSDEMLTNYCQCSWNCRNYRPNSHYAHWKGLMWILCEFSAVVFSHFRDVRTPVWYWRAGCGRWRHRFAVDTVSVDEQAYQCCWRQSSRTGSILAQVIHIAGWWNCRFPCRLLLFNQPCVYIDKLKTLFLLSPFCPDFFTTHSLPPIPSPLSLFYSQLQGAATGKQRHCRLVYFKQGFI